MIDIFSTPSLWSVLTSALRSWREDRATLHDLERLDERSREELATMIRLGDGGMVRRGRRIRQQEPECLAARDRP